MLTLTQARTLSISGVVLPAYFSERRRGKTTRTSAATWRAPIGMKLLGTAFKSMLLTSAAMLMTLPMPTLSRAETQTVQQRSVPAGRVSEMGESPAKKQMDASQQEQLLRIFGIGLQWATGEISFDEVTRSLGAPSRYDATAWDAGADKSEYSYFLDGMTVDFIYDKARLVDGKPAVNELRIDVDEHVQTNIPKEVFETRFSLHRRVVGESIDGVRTETSPYFLPSGIVAADNPNRARFGYRQLLPPDSPYDVHVGMDYLGKFENDGPEFRSLKNSVNLRAIQINRVYLTPKELQQREQAKRQKYGEMGLRTGMPCPETGVWQGFAESCTPDVTVVWKGRKFPSVRTLTHLEEREQRRPTSWVDGRWMWLREIDSTSLSGYSDQTFRHVDAS
ncbi:hypothetical protein LGN17_36330 [Burkholderia sp. AU30280]|uniref:hypothetical protein n=1 Tax=Burkholderia sp. AU30280 TaxID=2879628 RepID=UPI001CF4B8FF|nr:hypothetical protein [Burkholderia sp. AU30280]MCA8277943.1 hypothetical protein [Burkholderia sp. AU30280]